VNSLLRLVAIVLACVTTFATGVWYGGRNSSRNVTVDALPIGGSTATAAAAGAHAGSTTVRRVGEAVTEAEFARALGNASYAERNFHVADLLRGLTAQNWREVAAAFERERRLTGRTFPEEMALFAYRLGEVAGGEGADFFAESKDLELLRKALTGWAGKDAQAALNWIARGQADEETRRRVKGAVIRGLAATEPDLAVRALEDVPVAGRDNYSYNFAATLVQAVGIAESANLIEGMARRAVANGSGGNDSIRHIFADFASIKLEHDFRYGEPRAAIEWLTSQMQQPYVDRTVIGEAAGMYARHDPMAALAWLQDYNRVPSSQNPANTYGYREFVYGWTQKEGAAAVGQWLLANPHQQNYDRLALNYATMVGSKDPAAAMAWVNAVPHPAVKKQTLEALQRAATPPPKR
jgi:hypothetical protein